VSIKVFFNDKMVARQQELSPSAHKPPLVIASWQAAGFPIEVVESSALTERQLCLAHDPGFVRDVLSGYLPNGFGNLDLEITNTTPYTGGSMLAAGREALANGRVAVSPTCGFHHAGYRSSALFCTFNGLMVTALALKQEGLLRKIGILDFDHHYGNGTDDIIGRLTLRDWVVHYSAGEAYAKPEQAEEFLRRIPEFIETMADCDLMLYQAGADPHINDRAGGWLTTEQLRQRDALVFRTAAMFELPVAWNLAGGYQWGEKRDLRPLLDIHDNTMRECVAVYGGSG
jgi:acetoin utilization deacetylase AcuC-like enzyme